MRVWQETITRREGEWTEFDPSYDWRQHADGATPREFVEASIKRTFDFLHSIRDGVREGDWTISPSGVSRFQIVHVGMWDGWPFWRPVPAVGYIGPLGRVEVQFFYSINRDSIERMK